VPDSEAENEARQILGRVAEQIRVATPPVTHDRLLPLIRETMHQSVPQQRETPSFTQGESVRVKRIRESISQATPEEQSILWHYYVERSTIRQIASELRISETSIRDLLRRIRRVQRVWDN
jgi:DNA-directed RNA polymerase specialized sigma24 family protein